MKHQASKALLGLFLAAAAAVGTGGCGTPGSTVETFGPEPTQPIPTRAGTVIAEGCTLDSWQQETLLSAPAHRVLSTVVLVCPTVHTDGTVSPVDPDAQSALQKQVNDVRAAGYKVHLAVQMGDDFGTPYSAQRDGQAFASTVWQAQVLKALAPFAAMADGIEIDLQKVPDTIRADLSKFVMTAAPQLRSMASRLGIFVPPSTRYPSDVPGGDAYDLSALAPNVDIVRVMTLDFSTGSGGGPTIDTGWAVDAVRFAQAVTGATPVDISYPLYGTDFGSLGERSVTYLEATAVADTARVVPQRGPTGALTYGWTDEESHAHQTWYDDGVSTVRALHAWDPGTLPTNVGVTFYGLGAEDPALWDVLSRGLP